MKVTTEGCILGASITIRGGETNILDIGTGTGLLALMAAQKSDANIDAIEINNQSAEQARSNFNQSPWKDRLSIITGSIQDYSMACSKVYDLIICNPPFFSNHHKSGKNKDVAIHNDFLPQEELLKSAKKLLPVHGSFWVIYPEYEFSEFERSASNLGLHLSHEIKIFNHERAKPLRQIGCFHFQPTAQLSSTLIIKDAKNHYTESFQRLLKDFYLDL